MHKYISSAKQTGKAVTFAEVLLNWLGLCVEGEKDLGPGSLPWNSQRLQGPLCFPSNFSATYCNPENNVLSIQNEKHKTPNFHLIFAVSRLAGWLVPSISFQLCSTAVTFSISLLEHWQRINNRHTSQQSQLLSLNTHTTDFSTQHLGRWHCYLYKNIFILRWDMGVNKSYYTMWWQGKTAEHSLLNSKMLELTSFFPSQKKARFLHFNIMSIKEDLFCSQGI